MGKIQTLNDFKELVQAGLDNNEKSLNAFGKSANAQLKSYLIEVNNRKITDVGCPLGQWTSLEESNGWYVNSDDSDSEMLFLDTSMGRIWKLYSFLDVRKSDNAVDEWVRNRHGLDHCWLTRKHLLSWDGKKDWVERGLGVRFNDGLTPEESASRFSLKAWHGAEDKIAGLKDIIDAAKRDFAINSIRWEKRSVSGPLIAEWYSNGKVTINKAGNVDDILSIITEMAIRYKESLEHATSLRDSTLGSFEIEFSQNVDLDAFRDTVVQGKGAMRLWLMEVKSEPDFCRFKGVDLHNWDRVHVDLGKDYAFLTIPGRGCVNAAPRIANIQGLDNAGKTIIRFDGEEIFD